MTKDGSKHPFVQRACNVAVISYTSLACNPDAIPVIINSEEDYIKLLNDLNTLSASALTCKIYFNPTKCEFLRVTNKRT